MPARSFLLGLFCVLLLASDVFAQQPVQGEVKAHGATLTVTELLPDSFPLVRVVLRAQDATGSPIWDLRREQLSVRENGKSCEAVCLYPITIPNPISIGLVVDHSGSMLMEPGMTEDEFALLWELDSTGTWRLKPGIVTPLHRAKRAIRDFVDSFDGSKDSLALIGFADAVDVTVPLTQDMALIKRRTAALEADGWTALNDAVLAGLKQVGRSNGLKVLVVLTDGLDNMSRATLDKALAEARRTGIPVFTIGLGDADREALTLLAEGSGGQAFFTSSSEALQGIYADIGRNIRAFYNLTYRSEHFAMADTTRDVEVMLDFAGTQARDTARLNIPWGVLAQYEVQDKAALAAVRADAPDRTWWWVGGIATVTALGGGALAFSFRRKERAAVRLWPVPTDGELFIDLPDAFGTVRFADASGTVVKAYRLQNGINRFDLASLPAGPYVAEVVRAGTVSEAHRILKH